VTESILGVPVKPAAKELQRVLDTVIDLTDAKPAHMPRGRRRGSASEDHAQVAALVADGMRVQQAIAQVATQAGKPRHTIQNNYYRTKRRLTIDSPSAASSGVVTMPTQAARTPARRRMEASPRRATSRKSSVAPSPGIDGITAELVKTAEALARAARAQRAELDALRGKFEAIRGVLGQPQR
jgi:hypothetical protein